MLLSVHPNYKRRLQKIQSGLCLKQCAVNTDFNMSAFRYGDVFTLLTPKEFICEDYLAGENISLPQNFFSATIQNLLKEIPLAVCPGKPARG